MAKNWSLGASAASSVIASGANWQRAARRGVLGPTRHARISAVAASPTRPTCAPSTVAVSASAASSRESRDRVTPSCDVSSLLEVAEGNVRLVNHR